MVRMARFRHILAHAYAKIDIKKMYEILQGNLSDIEEYIMCLRDKLKQRGIDITKM